MPTTFSPLDVLLRTSTRWRAVELHVELTSTNDMLRGRAERGEPDGLVVVADHQTEGHGRRHPWVDEPGGALLVSFLVRLPAWAASSVSFAAGLALDDAVADLDVTTRLVWPNRVEVADRAVGGVLVDAGGRDPRWFVIGMGVNVATDADLDEAWIALSEAAGRDVDRFEVLAGLMSALEGWLRAVEDEPDGVAAAYRERCATLGSEVVVRTPTGEELTGVAADLDERGALVLDTGSERVRVPAGEVVSAMRPAPR